MTIGQALNLSELPLGCAEVALEEGDHAGHDRGVSQQDRIAHFLGDEFCFVDQRPGARHVTSHRGQVGLIGQTQQLGVGRSQLLREFSHSRRVVGLLLTGVRRGDEERPAAENPQLELSTRTLGSIGLGGEQVERAIQVGNGLAVGESPLDTLGCEREKVDRAIDVSATIVVECELRCYGFKTALVRLLQSSGDSLVKRPSPPSHHTFISDSSQRLMEELEALDLAPVRPACPADVSHESAPARKTTADALDVFRFGVQCSGDTLRCKGRPDDAGCLENVHFLRTHFLELGLDDVTETAKTHRPKNVARGIHVPTVILSRHHTPSLHVVGQGDDEERVAVGHFVECRHEPGFEFGTFELLDEVLSNRRLVDRSERQIVARPLLREPSLQRSHGVLTHGCVHGTIGGQDQESCRFRSQRHCSQKIDGRRVAPVEVLEPQHDHLLRGHGFEGDVEFAQHTDRRPGLRAGSPTFRMSFEPGELREPARRVRFEHLSQRRAARVVQQPSKRVQYRKVGLALAVQLDTLATSHEDRLVLAVAYMLLEEGPDQAGLSNARLAAHEDQLARARAGGLEEPTQLLQFGPTTEEVIVASAHG